MLISPPPMDTHCSILLVHPLHVDPVNEGNCGGIFRVPWSTLYSQRVHPVLKICLKKKLCSYTLGKLYVKVTQENKIYLKYLP